MNQDKYIHLIYLKLQGVSSAVEAQELDEWLAQSPEHRKIQDEIAQSMKLLDDFKPDFRVDTEGDYAEIKEQLELEKEESKVVPITSRRRWIGIAAAIAMILVAAFLFRNMSEPELEWQVLEATNKAKQQISLADGTTVVLNKNSKLTYPRNFLGNNRPVKLEGEAFFIVKRNTEQPFQVLTQDATVEVLGTEFNVKAHPDEKTATVTVRTGKVAFSGKESKQRVILTLGEAATLDKASKIITKQSSSNPNVFSYQSGALSFKNTPLTTVFEDLERHFEIQIENQNPDLKACKCTMNMKQVDLDDIWNTLKRLYSIKVSDDGKGNYTISDGGC